MALKKHEREAFEIIRDMVGPHGMMTRTQPGGKHLAVVVTMADGTDHKFPIASSPKNVGNMLGNVRQEVNAWLDRVGVGSGRGAPPAKPRKRRRQGRVRSTVWRYEVGGCRISEDPWAALAVLLEK